MTEGFLQLAAEIFECPRETLSLSTRRGSVAGWDSINHLRLVMEAERRFGVRYALEEIPALETLGDFSLRFAFLSADAKDVVADVAKSMPVGYKLAASDAIAVVFVSEQRMIVRVNGKDSTYRVSTAKAGVGSKAGSGKTPLGWHKVKARYGSKANVGQLFDARKMVKGVVRTEKEWCGGSGDEVLSRIFWLEGLEPGLNKDPKGNYDSYLRYIYIHGTNQEELLGTPASHGCIRMGNCDVVELFDLVEPCKNFYVYIKR